MSKRLIQLLVVASLLVPASVSLAAGKTAQASKAKSPAGVIHLKRIVFHVRPQKPLVSVDMQRQPVQIETRAHQSFVSRISATNL